MPFKKKGKKDKAEQPAAPKAEKVEKVYVEAQEKESAQPVERSDSKIPVNKEMVRYWAKKGLTAEQVAEKYGISLAAVHRLGRKVFPR